MKDTLEIDGYTITIMPDECAENPFENWDCEPPLLVKGYRYETGYYKAREDKQAITAWDFLALIPDEKLADLVAEFDLEMEPEDGPDEIRDAVAERCDGFDDLETLAEYAGTPYERRTVRGCCQSDWADAFVAALPEWVKETGIDPANTELLRKQCENAAELYGYWAFGDVYGVASITDPDGEELEDASVWGFYGPDHEESGLLEHARSMIAWHKEQVAKEALEREAMACRDICTVA